MKVLRGETVIKQFSIDSTIIKRFIGIKENDISENRKKEKFIKSPIVCVTFKGKCADFLFGEAETIENYALNGIKNKNFNENIFLFYENVPFETFLIDSSEFIENGDYTSCSEAVKEMKSTINQGNDKMIAAENALKEVFRKNNIASSIFVDYFYLRYRMEKYLSVNGSLVGESNREREERFENLYKLFLVEFDLLGRNLMSPKDIREAGLKPKKPHITPKGQVYFCETLSQLYADYIDYLRSENLFFKKCAACGKAFYADNYRTKYDSECVKLQIKENHSKSEKKYKSDTTWLLCYKERNNYNNFRKRSHYKNAPVSYQKEYDDLFEEFKQELKNKKKTFEKIKKGESIQYSLSAWLNGSQYEKNGKVVIKIGIIQRRKDLEKKIKNHLENGQKT